TVPAAELTGGRELVLAAAGFPLLVFGVRADATAGEGVGEPAVAPRRIRRRIDGMTAALRSAGVQRWPQRIGSEHRQARTADLLALVSGEIGDDFLIFDPLGEVPDAGPGVSVHRDFEEFVVALKHVLAGCQDIPGSLLAQLAARVR